MSRHFATLATIWRLASPYFFSEDRWPGRILLAAVIAIELSIVGITVLLTIVLGVYPSLFGKLADVAVLARL